MRKSIDSKFLRAKLLCRLEYTQLEAPGRNESEQEEIGGNRTKKTTDFTTWNRIGSGKEKEETRIYRLYNRPITMEIRREANESGWQGNASIRRFFRRDQHENKTLGMGYQ